LTKNEESENFHRRLKIPQAWLIELRLPRQHPAIDSHSITMTTPSMKKSSSPGNSSKPARKRQAVPRLSNTRPPSGIAIEDWQTELRRQFGREQAFLLENLGSEPFLSEFSVTNPQSGGHYRVAIRGTEPGENYCSCPDFATNDLGTCKHIEFTLGKLERKRGGKTALKLGFCRNYSEIYLNYAGERSVRFRQGIACSPKVTQLVEQLFDLNMGSMLAPERYAELPTFLSASQKAGHEVRCYDDALAFIAEVRDAQERGRILDHAYPPGASRFTLAGLLKIDLYPYQAEGALFAARAGRALIGDEMGLGKTIQAIAAAELMARHFGAERVLVICPTSLKHQWQREIARFSGREAQTIHGLRTVRQQQYQDDVQCKITNYETLARDLDLIKTWSPDLVIVDEAQRIKNWNTIAARALKRIASPYAIVLTGTPLENRLEELISIVQFVDRHRLGPTWRLLHEHQNRDDTGRVVGYRALDRIGATLAPIMLRRRKAEVLDQLPPRVDNTLFVGMTEQQMVHHEENGVTVSRIVQRWRKTGYLSDVDQRRLTCSLQNMRMSCNSTFLLDHETDHGVKADELVTLLEDLFEDPSAKAVVFSQWVRTHEVIIRRLEAKGWGHVLFHGGVPSERRPALVDRFHADSDCRVFLSTDAGGVGLNLQHAAATIVNMDLPWNPAVLEQRIGRVYRIGQARSVQVINLVAQGTIEEGMLSLLAFKKSLFAGVLDGGENEIFMNGTRLSKFMESVEEVTTTMGEPASPVEPIMAEQAVQRAPDEASDPAGTGVVSADDAVPDPVRANAPGESIQGDPWAPLIDICRSFIDVLTAAQGPDAGASGARVPNWIKVDAETGKPYLKLPMPEPATVHRLADMLGGLLAGLRR
jgi:superfamily II DNA or RNA helicase